MVKSHKSSKGEVSNKKNNNNNKPKGDLKQPPTKPSPRRLRSTTRRAAIAQQQQQSQSITSTNQPLNFSSSSAPKQTSSTTRNSSINNTLSNSPWDCTNCGLSNHPGERCGSCSAYKEEDTKINSKQKAKSLNNNFGNNSNNTMSRRGNNNNAAAAAARGGSSSDSEEDEQLSRLLNRLQREHATNFPDSNSNNSNNNTVNRTRARYLLEASAGNVGLASALYWEDYLAESAQQLGGNGGAAENPLPEDLHRSSSSGGASISSTAAVAGSKSVKSSKKKSSFEKAEGGTSGARDRYLKAAAASSSARKKPPARKPDPNEWNLDRRKPALPSSSGGYKKRKSSDSGGIDFSGIPKKRSRRSNSNDSDDADDRKPSAREKIKIKKEPGLSSGSGSGSMDSSDGGGVGEFRRRAGPKDDSLSRELDEKISSLQNRLMAYRSQLEASSASAGGGEFAAAAGRRNLDAASALGISPGRFAAADAALRGGSGADAFAAAMNAILRVDPSVNPREGYESWLAELGRSAGSRNARSAAGAGGNGGDDDNDDDSDNESNSSNNAKSGRDELDDSNSSGNRNNARDGADNEDDNDEDDAPLRRSMRLRSQRNPLPRRPNPRAARLAAQRRLDEDDSDEDIDENPPLNPADRLRARLANAAIDHNVNGIPVHDAMDVSDPDDDDITFLPGPVPVFRLKKKRPGEPRYQSAKNSKDIWNKPSLLQKYMQDSDEELDEEPVDIDIWLNKSASFEDPSKELWGSYPRNEDESDDDDSDDEGRVDIPISWLRSGFKLSKCGDGLAVSSPSDEEWERRRKTSSVLVKTGPLKDAKGLFPYNCQGVSALLSIVTALLYSGASVQGGSMVACDTEKAPFDSLSLEQRKREFDPRLVEALSSLIFIAAKAGSRRCEATLKAYEEQWARRRRKGPIKPEEEDTYTIKRLELQRRCRVAPVCWWEMDLAGNITKLPEGKDPKDVHFKKVRVSIVHDVNSCVPYEVSEIQVLHLAFMTSNTNIHDIKSYVRTHLKSFKEPGGMALFLETVLRCHGPTLKLPKNLLNHQGPDALKQLEIKFKKNKSGGNEVVLSKVHDCMSVELLSLLLTGEIHNSYTSWDADIFGIGLIQRNNKTVLSPKMLRPVKPIWLCFGDLGYSTLFLDTKNFIGSLNTLDNPGRAFLLSHWNVWSGDRTSFRVITSMHDGVFQQDTQKTTLSLGVIPDDSDSEEEEEGRTVKDSISRNLYLEEKRNASVQDTVASYQDQAFKPDLKPIADEELTSVSFHPEDEKYYPTQFRRWRFHFGSDTSSGATTAELSASDDGWIPFYRLHGRQRLIVEMKLAPLICTIVRSRWPMATVRDFAAGKVPIV